MPLTRSVVNKAIVTPDTSMMTDIQINRILRGERFRRDHRHFVSSNNQNQEEKCDFIIAWFEYNWCILVKRWKAVLFILHWRNNSGHPRARASCCQRAG